MVQSRVAVARSASSIYIANVVVLIANTLYFLILTNVLRSTLNVGIMTALNLMIWLLVTVSILAQPVTVQSPIPAPPAVLKFIPELLTRKAHSAAIRAFTTSLTMCAVIAVIIGGALIAAPSVATPFLGGIAVQLVFIQLAGADVILLSLGQICLASLMSTGNMRSATGYIILWSVLRYALASVLLFNFAIEGVLIGWILGDGLLLAIALRGSFVSLRGHAGNPAFSMLDFVRYSSYTFLSALIGYAINQADKLLTLAQQGLSQLAVYNVAIVAASFAGLAPYALTMVLLPTLSSLHASDQKSEMRKIVRQYSRYVSIIVIPIAFGFAAITAVALRIFGPEYASGLLPSVIVSVTAGLTAIGAVYAAVLLAIGELKWYTAANVIGLASLAAVAYVATPLVGLPGPALGRAGLMIFSALVYAYAAFRIGFLELDTKAFLSATASSTVMGIVVFYALSFVHTLVAKLAMLPVVVVVGALFYLGGLRALKLLKADDLEFIREIVPTKLHGIVSLIARVGGVN